MLAAILSVPQSHLQPPAEPALGEEATLQMLRLNTKRNEKGNMNIGHFHMKRKLDAALNLSQLEQDPRSSRRRAGQAPNRPRATRASWLLECNCPPQLEAIVPEGTAPLCSPHTHPPAPPSPSDGRLTGTSADAGAPEGFRSPKSAKLPRSRSPTRACRNPGYFCSVRYRKRQEGKCSPPDSRSISPLQLLSKRLPKRCRESPMKARAPRETDAHQPPDRQGEVTAPRHPEHPSARQTASDWVLPMTYGTSGAPRNRSG